MDDNLFGRYRLMGLIGAGGMGQVYRAFDTETDRIVALKVLPDHLLADAEFGRRFRREAKIAAALADPHIVPIHHFGEIDGRLYVDMRLIEGRDLASIIARKPMDPKKAVAYIEQLAEALHSAHSVGLVHRDVKPSNVLITERDFAYLIDFGIAQAVGDTRLTETGLAIGTFAYMAPERMSSGEYDARADIYSLACVLHECLTGRPPFQGSGIEQLVAAHLITNPPQPSTQIASLAPFDAVIAKGMAKDPIDRYPDTISLAAEARQSLQALIPTRTDESADSQHIPAQRQQVKFPRTSSESTVSATQFAASIASTQAAKPTSRPHQSDKRPKTTSAQNQQRRAAAKRKLEEELARQTRSAKQRRLVTFGASAAAVVTAVAAVVATVWLAVDFEGSQSSPSIVSTNPDENTPQPVADGRLPTFAAPAGLGQDCQYPAAGTASKQVNPPRTGAIPMDEAEVSVSMTTDQGNIGLLLNNAQAPCTVNSFASLAQQGYFNDTPCHRLTNSDSLSVLQCGDPTGQGTGGPGYQFANEYPTNQYQPDNPALQQPVLYPRGTVAMANAGPGTNGSQFFLVYKDSQLPPSYTVFGIIDETGLVTLDKIAAGGVAGGGQDGTPAIAVTVRSIQLD